MFHNLLGYDPSNGLAIILLAGAAVFAFSLGILALLAALADPLRRRLGRLGGGGEETSPSRAAGLAQLLRPVSRYMMPSKEAERSKVERALIHAGLRSASALPIFYASKTLLLIAAPVLVLIASPFFPRVTTSRLLLIAGVAAFLGALLPGMWLDRRVLKRQRALRVAFPDALDLLVVCVEAGLGLAPALQRVADDLGVSHPELGGELALVNAEMRVGVERTQALKNLAYRTGLDDIKGLVALLVQTMRFGTGVADALRVYSEEFRDKRMQAAEEQAALIGTKMIFPLVTCLFPSFFLVMVGPALVRLAVVFQNFHN
ncbi:MAG: type II secretion system F family protein [Steroidobacteraceae bacterium]